MISLSQRPLPDNTQQSQQTDIHVPGGILTHDLSMRLRARGHWDRPYQDNLRNLLTDSDPTRICRQIQKEEVKGTYLQSRGPGAASIIEIRYNRMPVDSSSGRTRAHPLDIAL
jgi:hypothetical protein